MLAATVNSQMVIAKNPDGCLSLFPLPVWEQFEADLRKMGLATRDAASLRFHLLPAVKRRCAITDAE